MTLRSRKMFWFVVVATTIIRCLLACSIPLTTDEAYFSMWARYPEWGYYDHPPMTGWVLWSFGQVLDHYLFYRLFSVLTGVVTAGVLYQIVAGEDVERARVASIAFLISPVNLMLVAITNDVVLLFFSMLSIFAVYRFHRSEKRIWLVGSGLLAGAAFLSKYFAVFVIAGVLYYLWKHRERWVFDAGLYLVGVAPFVVQHTLFNAHNCWVNLVFNMVSRSSGNLFTPMNLLLFLLTVAYLFTPWGLWHAFRHREKRRSFPYQLAYYIVAVGLGVLTVVSLRREIGLHWLLILIPPGYLVFGWGTESAQRRLISWTGLFTACHALLLFGILAIPIDTFQGKSFYPDVVMSAKHEAVCQQIEKYSSDNVFTSSYSTASVLGHHCGRYIGVMFSHSKYGRQYDVWNHLNQRGGENFLFVFRGKDVPGKLSTYFRSTHRDKQLIHGARFTFVRARRFHYQRYRQRHLTKIANTYYNPPEVLPRWGCPFETLLGTKR